jgi:molybdopterin guanine dinucleotide-containing S/N-oxide reductase-like protein
MTESRKCSAKIRTDDKENNSTQIIPKTLGFIGFGNDSNALNVDVRNGRIIRLRPWRDNAADSAQRLKPWKMEARGKVFESPVKALISPLTLAYKNRIYSPNRILYPLKRVDWEAGGDRHPENRGKSGYVRISWDEAAEIVAGEIRRVRQKYGLSAILSQSDGHGETKTIHNAHGCSKVLLDMLGSCTWQHRNADSWEGWYWGARNVWGCEPVGEQVTQSNLFPDIAENTQMLLFWGCDPETTPWGFSGQMPSRLCYWFSQLDIKSVYISPDLNYGAAVHADKWIPIRPNTDAALQLAIACVWISEGTYEKEYVKSHSVGFDRFADYVMGKEDGLPKTPDWAAEITGIPSWTIKSLAREWAAMNTSIAHGNGGCYIRGPYSHEPGRLEVILLGMQGLGKPGRHQVKMIEWGIFGNKERPMSLDNPPFPRPKVYPNTGEANMGWNPAAMKSRPKVEPFIPKDLIHDALSNKSISWYGTTLARTPAEDQFVKYEYPMKGCSEIHMIWTDSPCWITCWNDSNSYIKALKSPKIECIVAEHPWMENDCQFADIVLPANTKFEVEDISADTLSGNYTALFCEGKCIESRGESKSDYEIACLIADKLGLLKEYTRGTTTEEKIKQGFETSGVEKLTTYREFKEKGYFVVPTDPDWKKYPVGMSEFCKDPEKHPLSTPSGKLEFYSERLARMFPDDKERPPSPHWIPYGETHQESLLHPRSKQYPLLVISNHGRWRVHAQHDDMTWLREIETCKIKGPDGYAYQPVWINPTDAVKRGIRHGDIVKIYNERGAVLAGAFVTERMSIDAVSIDHGARYDAIIPGELDRGGAINTITPHKTTSKNTTGMAVGGFLVEIEKANLEELRRKYPEEFKRPYSADAGLVFERILAKDKPN